MVKKQIDYAAKFEKTGYLCQSIDIETHYGDNHP